MIHYKDWTASKKSIYVYNWEGEKRYFCPRIEVTGRFRDVSTKSLFLEVSFILDHAVESVIFNRRLLAEKIIPKLVEHGFSIVETEVSEHTLSEIFMDQEDNFYLEACHSKLGYQPVNGELLYFGEHEISGKLTTRYVGEHNLTREGAYCEWQNFVKELLKKNALLALPLAMGVSAPVATRLKNAGSTDETALWALIGTTSTGKTSCLKWSASPWGKPSGDGIIDNLTGTEKYFFASLADREGWPNFIDETSAVAWDFTKAIYTVALSREGGRCNPDGTPKKRKNWSGAVIFTGETSMFHRTNGNGGLYARLVEFDFSWFDNGETPERISRFVAHNYGTAWLELIPYLQSIDDRTLETLYDSNIEEISKAIAIKSGYDDETWRNKNYSGIQHRIIKKIALLLLSVDVMTTAWDMSVDRNVVVQHLVTAYEHNASRIDKIDAFAETLVQHIARYREAFPEVRGSTYNTSAQSSARGFQDVYKQQNCVWILSSEFEEQLHKHGLDSSPSTLKELHKRGLIEYFGDRYRKKYRTGNIAPTCYCFYPKNNQTPTTKAKKKKSKNKEMSKQLKSLLED